MAAAPRALRTLALTDLAWSCAARAATLAAALAARGPRAVIYSTITAALLAPAPGAIRFDALARPEPPRRHGVWQRPRERAVLAPRAAAAARQRGGADGAPPGSPRAGGRHADRRRSAPGRRWRRRSATSPRSPTPPTRTRRGSTACSRPGRAARRDGEELVDRRAARRRRGSTACARSASLERSAYRALLRRARIYLAAPRREEYGIAQLEALADGAMLVSTETEVPYAALGPARAVDARLIGPDLAARSGSRSMTRGRTTQRRPAPLLEPFSPASVDRVVARAGPAAAAQRAA